MATHAHTASSIGRGLLGLAVLWGLIGLTALASGARDIEATRATLRGLQGVRVSIEPVLPAMERLGLTQQQLQTTTEGQLRQAGIPVLTKPEWLRAPGVPSLFVSVVTILLESQDLVAYGIRIELHQRALLDINSSPAFVVTWNEAAWGTVARVRVAETIRDNMMYYINQFISAYLSVNSRPAGSAAPSSASPRRDLVRQAQERLQASGFNPGTIDGSMGPQTRQALLWFQNTKGILATGDLDEKTLNALEVR